MALDQQTIDTGIGGRLATLDKRQGQLLNQDAALSQQQVDIANQSAGLIRQKMAETQPAREKLAAKASQPPDRTVKEEPTPDYQRPTMDPKDMHEAMGMLMAASMLTGIASRSPYNNVMTAMTGALNGFVKKDHELVVESLATFDKNLTAIKEKNAQKRRAVTDAWEKYKNDLLGLKTELELIAAKYDDPLALQAARSKSLAEMQKLIDTNIRATDQAVTRLEGVRERAETAAARLAEAGARRAEANARADERRQDRLDLEGSKEKRKEATMLNANLRKDLAPLQKELDTIDQVQTLLQDPDPGARIAGMRMLQRMIGGSTRLKQDVTQLANFGRLDQRIVGHITTFFAGSMTDEQYRQVIDATDALKNEVLAPRMDNARRKAAESAQRRGLDAELVFMGLGEPPAPAAAPGAPAPGGAPPGPSGSSPPGPAPAPSPGAGAPPAAGKDKASLDYWLGKPGGR